MDDAFRIRIGDVYQKQSKEIILACSHCTEEFEYFTEFSLHVQEHLEQLWQHNKVQIVVDEVQEHDRLLHGPIESVDPKGMLAITVPPAENTTIWIKTEEPIDESSAGAFEIIDNVKYSQKEQSESIDPIEEISAIKTENEPENTIEQHQTPLASTSSKPRVASVDPKDPKNPSSSKNRSDSLTNRPSSTHTSAGYCDLCNKNFIRRTNYKQHMESKHPNVPLKPMDGPTDYRINPVQLKRTISSWECYMCHRDFAQNDGLREHFHVKHTSVPVLCTICGKQVKTKSYLRRHMEKHNKERSHACDKCDKRFTSRRGLLSHRKKVHNVFVGGKCKYCSKEFGHRDELQEHIKSHTLEEKQYACSMCNFVTPVAARLKSHAAIHSTERTFECPVCHKKYREVSAGNHMRTHSDERNFKCPVCDKGFRSMQALRLHSIRHDKTNCRMYKCDVCDIAYPYKQALLKHRRLHTDQPMAFHCEYCKLGFLTAETVRTHEMKHMRNELDK